MLLLNLLLILMVLAAVVAVEIKNLLSSIVALGAVGFALTLSFLVLQAPDLALVQLVVEIISLVFMVAVILNTTQQDYTQRRLGGREIISIFALSVFFFIAYLALKKLPAFGHPLMSVSQKYVDTALVNTGATNVVSSVILDFRAYDTLGEATVLFAAVIGVLVILRRVGRKPLTKVYKQTSSKV
jgi:multisubunit Na+/H+ antiporter MnhB subunit